MTHDNNKTMIGFLLFGATILGFAAWLYFRDQDKSRFKVIKKLGSGGFGTVYHVRDVEGNDFALKKLNKLNKSTLDSAMQEINILSKLDHNNIVRFMTAFKTRSKVCIVMELMEGSVKSYMEKQDGRLNEDQAKSFTKDALQGLIYLHKPNIHAHNTTQYTIHRDIRCDNILIDKNGTAKLADMGIAKISGGGDIDYSDVTSHITGIPYWQAPEIIKGTEPPGRRSDIWMLGITVWEMIEGQPPLRGLDLERFLFRIRKNPGLHLEELQKRSMSNKLKNFLEQIFVERDERLYAEQVDALPWLDLS